MIRTNLSTRPFYNERAVHFWLLMILLAVVAATIFNVSRVLRYSRSDTQLATQASRDESRAADLRRQAAALRATVDPRQIDFASNEARQANELIDRRTFSWTELLNTFEKTLPDDVRIAAVRPRLERTRGVVVTVNAVARGNEDVDEFVQNLERTGEFADVLAIEEHFNEQGLLESTVEMTYLVANAKAAVPEEPATNESPAAPAPPDTGAPPAKTAPPEATAPEEALTKSGSTAKPAPTKPGAPVKPPAPDGAPRQ